MQSKLRIKCNGSFKPLAIAIGEGPYFSWTYGEGFSDGFMQSAYQIQVYDVADGLLWDTGRVAGGKQHMVSYDGTGLQPLSVYRATVTVWDSDATEAATGTVSFETEPGEALLAKGRWLSGGTMLRRIFEIPDGVRNVRAYATCVGYYELYVNGQKAGDQCLTPSHTDPGLWVEYQAYDVTDLVSSGVNTIGLVLGHGMPQNDPYYVKEPHALCMLVAELADRTKIVLYSDEHWAVVPGPIVRNNLFEGETHDARLEQADWCTPSYDGPTGPVQVVSAPAGRLHSQILPPIRQVETRLPVSITKHATGAYILDYGQNLTGHVRLAVSGPEGTEITLRHAEYLDDDGDIDQRNLRIIDLHDRYILKGEGVEVWEPRFTYHGFRYVRVEGWPGVPEGESLKAVVVRSDVPQTGEFACSNQQYERIHSAMWWTLAGNLHSIPTDCPQRNERRGWMGDGQIASDACIYNFDMHWFYRKWMEDLLGVVDMNTGEVMHATAPRWLDTPFFPWSAALFVIPWNLLKYYDDMPLIARVYPVLKKVISRFAAYSGEDGLILEPGRLDSAIKWDTTYDDWLSLDRTRNVQVINGYFYMEYRMMEVFAELLGEHDDAVHFAVEATKVRDAYNALFVSPDVNIPVFNGVYGSAFNVSQFGQALPLSLGMVPESHEDLTLEFLLWDIQKARGSTQLSTGILGTKCLFYILEKYGRNDVAAELFNRREFPGWGFMLACGATTVWERWHRMLGAEMNSHSHPALAAPDTWFYRALAGLDYGRTDSEGRRCFKIKPYFAPGLDYARANCDTPWGTVKAGWHRKGNVVTVEVTLPPNTTAEVSAGETQVMLGSGQHTLSLTES